MKLQPRVLSVGLFLFSLGCQPIRATTTGVLVQPGAAPSATATPAALVAAPVTSTSVLTVDAAITAPLTLTITTPITATDTALADGRTLYRQYYCGICHQSTGAETRGTFGPSHDGLGAIAVQRLQEPTYQGDATTAAEYLHESLVDPQRFVVPGYELTPHRMPAYSFLAPEDLTILVTWLSQQ